MSERESDVRVSVRCYGPARRAAGRDVIDVDVAEPATVADVMVALGAMSGEFGDDFGAMLGTCAVGVGDAIVGHDQVIDPAHLDEVALLPPVAGG